MIQSRFLPIVVRINKLRWKYRQQKLRLNECYHVISYDMKYLLITDKTINKVYKVRWEDIGIVQAEYISFNQTKNNNLLAEVKTLRQSISKLESTISRQRKNTLH